MNPHDVDAQVGANRRPITSELPAILALLAVCAGLFGPLVFAGSPRVLSHDTGDTSQFFIPVREFAVNEILAGRLPLWNPYLMSGTTFIGNFQSAMFYPLNAVYLMLPVWRAVNVDYAVHFSLFALFMYAWARVRGISRSGGFLAALCASLGAPFYLRMLAGQVTMVDAMAWAPLIFYCIDAVFDRAAARRPLFGTVLMGVAGVGLQVLAGHPQTVFITAMTAAIYCVLRFPGATRRIHATVALAIMAGWGIALSAIQLLPGLETVNESLRTDGTRSFEFATTFSFPPENLLTLIAPAFFGDRPYLDNWGRWGFWDANAFIGVSALVLAVYGAKYADRSVRRFAPFVVLLLVFVSFGNFSPIYNVFNVVPVFGSLRGVSKFLFVAAMFAGVLCGAGLDRLARDATTVRPRRVARVAWAMCPAIAAAVGAIAVAAFLRGGEAWKEALFHHLNSGLFATSWFTSGDEFFRSAAWWAMGSLAVGGATLALTGVLLWNAHRGKRILAMLTALACTELFAFAALYRSTFDPALLDDPAVRSLGDDHPGDYRVLLLAGPESVYHRNALMSKRRSTLWGYEPVILQRYGMFIATVSSPNIQTLPVTLNHARWGSDVIQIGLNMEHIDFLEDPPSGTVYLPAAFDLARCRFVVVPEGMPNTQPGVYENPGALPRFLFINDYIVLTHPRAILQAINEPLFDPRRQVYLEEQPNPTPIPSSPAKNTLVVVEDESTDHVTLLVTTDNPSILVMTDPISSGLRITALEGSSQPSYDLLPANFAFRAIPLAAGTHHFRIEYRPRGFELGLRITVIASILFAAALVYALILGGGSYVAKKAR